MICKCAGMMRCHETKAAYVHTCNACGRRYYEEKRKIIMKAFLINPTDKTITEVVFTGDYRNIYEHIDADAFTAVTLNQARDVVYVDDMGLYRNEQDFFMIEGYENPLPGKGLVLGTDDEGESTEPTYTNMEWLTGMVEFITGQEAYDIAKANDEEMAAAVTKTGEKFAVFWQPSAPLFAQFKDEA